MERIITIDGPAGAGKSTIAKRVAQRLGFQYLDTGAMYRTAALLGKRHGVDWNEPGELVALVRNHKIDCRGPLIFLDGEDVSQEIRSTEVTLLTHYASDNPEIREMMVQLQRQIAHDQEMVTEGRDQGSVVFPEAFRQFYLTASPQERARRRVNELRQRGEEPDEEEILSQINQRDFRDSSRKVGPLQKPRNAIVINSDRKTIDEVVDGMVKSVLDPRDPEII